jgi:hypothetical protein
MNFWTQKPPLGSQLNLGHCLANGLIGYWLMNEATGNRLADISNNRNQMVLTSGLWIPGSDGPSVLFNGTTSYGLVQAPKIALYSDQTSITVNLFCKYTTFTNLYNGLLSSGPRLQSSTPRDIPGWFFWNNYNTGILKFSVAKDVTVGSPVWVTTPTYTVVTGVPYMITGIWDISTFTAKLFVNGRFIGSTTNTNITSFAGDKLTIGRTGATDFSSISISSLQVWSRALTNQEVSQLYISPYCMISRPTYPVWMPGTVTVVGGQAAAKRFGGVPHMAVNKGVW